MPRKYIKHPVLAAALLIFLALFLSCEEDAAIPNDFYGKVFVNLPPPRPDVDIPVDSALIVLRTADSTADIPSKNPDRT